MKSRKCPKCGGIKARTSITCALCAQYAGVRLRRYVAEKQCGVAK